MQSRPRRPWPCRLRCWAVPAAPARRRRARTTNRALFSLPSPLFDDRMLTLQLPLLCGPGSVDRQRGAADVDGRIGAQENGERTDLLRRGELLRGLLLREQVDLGLLDGDMLLRRPRVDLLLHERRQHPARTDRVARDP